jgi:septum formation protein
VADPLSTAAPQRLVLASGSPRRRELLERLGLEFDVVPADIDESARPGEDAIAYVERLAREKAVAVGTDGDVVIAADTTVELDGEIFGKPVDADDARRMLARLSGRTHRVHTGVAVRRDGQARTGSATTFVQMVPLHRAAVEWYLGTGEPFDKAGAYALQGAGGVLVEKVTGSVSNVVGLPLTLLLELARQLGIELLG